MSTVTYTSPPCIVCGAVSHIEVDARELNRWLSGELIQAVWPHWSADQRELMITGTHPGCWDQMFGKVE